MMKFVKKRGSGGQTFAILLIVGACLAAHCAIAPTLGLQQARTLDGGTKQAQRSNDQAGSSFFLAREGKTSPRRVQQAQQPVTSNQQPQQQQFQSGGEQTTVASSGDGSQSTANTGSSSLATQNSRDESGTTITTAASLEQTPSSKQSGAQSGTLNAASRTQTELSVGGEQAVSQETIMGQQQQMMSGTEPSLARELQQQQQQTLLDSGSLSPETTQSTFGSFDGSGSNADSQTPGQRTASADAGRSEKRDSATVTGISNGMSMLEQQSISGSLEKQQDTGSGVPVSTPSSLSMSLDGMIVNSRPRANDNFVGGGQPGKQSGAGKKTKQQQSARVATSRIGELSQQFNTVAESVQNNFATMPTQNKNKATRRVPFTGVQFTSPATKGLRTKPRASNQIGSALGPMAQMSNILDQQQRQQQQQQQNVANFSPANMQTNQVFGRQQQQPPTGFRDSMLQQQLAMNDLQGGFEGDQQVRMDMQQLQANEQQSPMDAASLDLMRNLLASNAAMNSRTQSSRPDDMVMSVMSSADGKERRLVMIARDTLDSLQQFAAQNSRPANFINQQEPQEQQQQFVGTKSRQQSRVQTNNRQSISKPLVETNFVTQTPATNWMVTGQDMWTTNFDHQQQQRANQVPTTTTSPEPKSITGQQQDQFQSSFTTTTSSPISLGGGSSDTTVQSTVAPSQTVTTTTGSSQQQLSAATTTTQAPNFSSQDSQSSTVSPTQDSFREVAVSSSGSNNAVSSAGPGFTQLGGSGKQQVGKTSSQSKGGKSATSGGQIDSSSSQAKQQQQRGSATANGKGTKKSGANTSASGTKQTTSAKQQKSSGKLATGQQQKVSGSSTSSKSSGGKKLSGDNGSKKPVGGVKTKSSTNGQQFQQQQAAGATANSTQQPALVDQSTATAPPATTTTAGPAQSSVTFASSNLNEPVQLSGNVERVAELPQVSNAITTTTSSSVTSRRPTAVQQQQQQQTTTNMQAEELSQLGDQRESSSRQTDSDSSTSNRSGSAGRASSMVADEQLDKRLDELERSGQLIPSTMNLPSGSRAPVATSLSDSSMRSSSSSNNELDGLRAAIPGEPQLDYPIYSAPLKTSFDCASQSCPGGYYADLETQCQVFHVCQNDGRSDTFLCPNGTIFSQQHFVCVWWWQVDCQQSQQYYKLNDGIYCNSMFPSSASASSGVDTNSITSSNSAPGSPSQSTSSSSSRSSNGSPSSLGNTGDSSNQSDSASQNPQRDLSNTLTTDEANGDADLSQQQQQQLELLSRRA